MRKVRAAAGGLAVLLLAGLEGGCLVSVEHVSDPAPEFRRARSEAATLQGRHGPVRELKLLAYDPAERELVQLDVPLWLVRKLARNSEWEEAGDSAEGRAAHLAARHVSLQDLERAGPGVLVEAEEEDGEQVLIWLR